MAIRPLQTMLLAGAVFVILLDGDNTQAQTPERQSYQLGEIIDAALQHNPALREAGSLVKQGQGLQQIAAAYPNPTITGTMGPGKTREALGDLTFFERGVTLSQPLEWPGMRHARQHAAEAAVAGSQAALDGTRLNVIADIKVAFYQLLLAQRNVEITTQALTNSQDFYRNIKGRVDAGQARPFEALKADVEVQKVSNDLNHAKHALIIAQARLNALSGGILRKGFGVHGDFEVPRQTLHLENLLSIAIDQHPTIRRVRKQVEGAAHSVLQERRSVVPFVTISGSYHQEAAETAYLFRLSVPIPLWYRRQGEIATALSAKERAEAEQVRTENDLMVAITETLEEAHAAQDRIDVFEKGLLKQAEETLRIARVSFQQGAVSLLEVIDAQRVHRQTLLEYTDARANLSIALARLERWTGELQ